MSVKTIVRYMLCVCINVFYFKQKTAYEMRISDRSSDVCSSDLKRDQLQLLALPQERDAAWLLSEGQLYAADGRRCTSILYLQHAQDRPSVLSDIRNAALCIWRWSRWVRNPYHPYALRYLYSTRQSGPKLSRWRPPIITRHQTHNNMHTT